MRRALLALFLLASWGGACRAYAQDGTIAGRVTDPDGLPLPGANVQVVETTLGAATDPDGFFVIDAVPVGTYRLRATSVGYRADEQTVTVSPGRQSAVAFVLQARAVEAGSVLVRATPTATKSDAPVRIIPQAVAIVPRAVLEAQGASDATEALRNVAGVAVADRTEPFARFTLRGFPTDGTGTFRRNGVEFAHYNDGFNANVERVEVLKGPASVLYGRIEPGGVINLVTKRPLAERQAEAEAVLGLFGEAYAEADWTGPMGPLRYRVISSAERTGSWRDGVEEDAVFVSSALAGVPSGRIAWRVEGEVERASAVLDPGLALGGTTVPDGFNRAPFFGEPEADYGWDSAFALATLDAHVAEAWSLRATASVGRYRYDRGLMELDSLRQDGLVARSFRREVTRYRYLQSETTLSGGFRTGAVAHRLHVGLDLNRLAIGVVGTAPLREVDDELTFAAIAPVALDDPQPTGLPPTADQIEYLNVDGSGINAGLYAQERATVTLGTGRLHALVAGRVSRVTVGATWFALAQTEDTPAGLNVRDIAVTAFTPSGGVVYEPSQTLALYVSGGRSFNPIFNQVDEDGEPFEPTEGEQIEAGIKAERRGLSATLAVYHLTKRNAITREPDGFYIQTGAQRSRGLEVDVLGALRPGLTVAAQYAFTDAIVTDDALYAEGTRLPGAPRHSGSLWASVSAPDGAFRGLELSGGVFAVGPRFGALANDVEAPGYAVVDLGMTYAVRPGLTVHLVVSNVFDARYVVSAERRGGLEAPLVVAWPGAPRGARVRVTTRL
nr:ferrichrome-iron receptor [uncultured bacterium]